MREKVLDDGTPLGLRDVLEVVAYPNSMPQVPSQRALGSRMCEVLQGAVQPAQSAAEAVEQCRRMGFDFSENSPRHVGEHAHEMLLTVDSGSRCDALACGGNAHLLQQERGIVCGQVLQGLVLQVEIVLLLRCMRNFQYELLPCSSLEIEVGVMLPWQRTRLGLQTVQFESNAAGILYSEISCLMIDVQHVFTLENVGLSE